MVCACDPVIWPTEPYVLWFTELCNCIVCEFRSLKKNFTAPVYGWGSTASRLEPLRGGSLLFTTKSPEISGTHFTDLRRMKGWVDLKATQWFWARDPWIRNPAPWSLGHCSSLAVCLSRPFCGVALKGLGIVNGYCH